MRRSLDPRRLVLDRPWVLIIVAVLAFTAYELADERKQPYEVSATFASAVNVQPGMDVQLRGVDVGKITGVEYDEGKAIVKLGFHDGNVYPLRRGTTATLRYGTTIGNGTRYVQIEPGPESAPTIEAGGIISEKDTRSPVEVDQVFDTLNAKTRNRLQTMLEGTSRAIQGRSDKLNRGFRTLPGGVSTTGDVVADLLSDDTALRALIANTDRTMKTLSARRAAIADVISVARTTFGTFAARTGNVQATLSGLPSTLRQARSTLGRANGSLEKADDLFAALDPGAREIPTLARTASRALVRLEDVAPVAETTLRTARDAAPQLKTMLDTATPFAPRLEKALGTATPMLSCLRAYAPEIAGFFMTWGNFGKNYDQQSHYARIRVREGVTSFNGLVPDSAFPVALGHKYALPRPPGLNAGRASYPESCGITKAALDPAQDPEKP